MKGALIAMRLDGTMWKVSDAAALVAAVDKELAAAIAEDKGLVAKGRIKQQEADWRELVIADIRDDLLFHFAPLQDGEIFDANARGEPAVPWADKVRWIDRELDVRRREYPELVAKGRMTDDEARRRGNAIAELRRLYWNRMFMWFPPEGPAADYLRALAAAARLDRSGRVTVAINKTEGEKIYRELVRSHLLAVDQETGAAQGELAA
jgi:hypothetical protein